MKSLSRIREPIWLHLIENCSSFQARDCNACFSQIFEEKTFGNLNFEEARLFATQRVFDSYCQTCEKHVMVNDRIFLTYVTHSGLKKFGFDVCSWPLYVANVHTQPGRLLCKDCKSPTSKLNMKSTANSRFVFIEFAPEVMDGLIMYEKIEIDNSSYVLKGLVRNHSVHFTCAVHNDKKWFYFDDLNKYVREFTSIDLIQQQFELFCDNVVNDNKTVSATQTKKISENQGIDNQNDFNELVDDGNSNCNEVCRSSEVELQIEDKDKITASISCKPEIDTHGSRKKNSASSKSHSKGKKRKQTICNN